MLPYKLLSTYTAYTKLSYFFTMKISVKFVRKINETLIGPFIATIQLTLFACMYLMKLKFYFHMNHKNSIN